MKDNLKPFPFCGSEKQKLEKKRKFRAMTNGEFYRKFCSVVYCGPSSFKKEPYKTKDGKYLFIEVKNQRTGKKYIIIKVKK